MSYTGIIAEEELCEVAKDGDPEKGSWLVPAHRLDEYPDEDLVKYDEDDAGKGLRGAEEVPRGDVRLPPRGPRPGDVRLLLHARVADQGHRRAGPQAPARPGADDDGNVKTRAGAAGVPICEPALGSGAFLNEAINQVAEEYLRRRQDELGDVDPDRATRSPRSRRSRRTSRCTTPTAST